MGFCHLLLQRRLAQTEIGLGEGQHVVHRGAQGTSAREGWKIPVRDPPELHAVADGQPFPVVRREGDRGVGHPERFEKPFGDQPLVAHSLAQSEGVSQETGAEIRVFDLRTDVPLQLVRREELVELGDRVVGVRVPRIGRPEVVRHARQSRAMRRQVQQRDLCAVPRRYIDDRPEQPLHRRLELEGALPRQVRQQDRREHLGDRADLEHGVAIHCGRTVGRKLTMGDHAAAARVDNADDYADAPLLLVDPLRQDLAEFFVRRHRTRGLDTEARRSHQHQADKRDHGSSHDSCSSSRLAQSRMPRRRHIALTWNEFTSPRRERCLLCWPLGSLRYALPRYRIAQWCFVSVLSWPGAHTLSMAKIFLSWICATRRPAGAQAAASHIASGSGASSDRGW